jgi:hypothetical protein
VQFERGIIYIKCKLLYRVTRRDWHRIIMMVIMANREDLAKKGSS